MTTRLGPCCNLCEAICGLEFTLDDGRVTACGATRTTRSREGTSARRASRSPTSRPTPTGCAAVRRAAAPATGRRSPGTRRSTWPPTGWPRASNEHGRDAVGVYLGNPNVHTLGSLTHGRARPDLRTRNKFSATSVDQLPHQLVAYLLTATSC